MGAVGEEASEEDEISGTCRLNIGGWKGISVGGGKLRRMLKALVCQFV